jgi:hypothetical protein
LRKFLLVALIATTSITSVSAQKFGNKGGVGSNDSVYQGGEPANGTYSINGITGAAKLGPITSTGTITGTNVSGSVSGVNTGDQTNITGNSGTADKLKTPRTINGVSFDGGSNITINASDTTTRLASANNLSDLTVPATARTNLGVTATGADTGYAWRTNNLSDLANPITARNNIGAASSGANTDISSITGSAAKWTTARSLSTSGDASWSVSLDGSVSVSAPITFATVNATPGTYGSSLQVPVISVNGKGLITGMSSSALGTSASINTGSSGNTIPLLNGTNTWDNSQTFSNTTYFNRYASDVNASAIYLQKAKGTVAAPEVVGSGEAIGAIDFKAWDGTAFTRGGAIQVVTTGVPSVGVVPSRFQVRLNGALGTNFIAMVVGGDGSLVTTGPISGTNLSGTNTGDQINITGNAGTATKLAIARTINGVPFDGTANITIGEVGGGASATALQQANNLSDVSSVATARTNLGVSATGTDPNFANLTGATFTGAISALNLSGTNTGDQTSVTGNAGTATKLATARSLSVTGDLSWTSPTFDGTANVTAAGTLAASGVTAGTYTTANITVDAKGRVTAASNGSSGNTGTVTSVSVATANGVSGTVATATTTPAITLSLGAITPSSVAATGTVAGSNITSTGNVIGNAATATKWATQRTLSIIGDGSGFTTSFDGSANASIPLTLANSGVTAGTYGSVSSIPSLAIDSKGRITAASSSAITLGTMSSQQANNVTITGGNITGLSSLATTGIVQAQTGAFSGATFGGLTGKQMLAGYENTNRLRTYLQSYDFTAGQNTPAMIIASALDFRISPTNGLAEVPAMSLNGPIAHYTSDTAAATAGVPVNGLYRNGKSLMIRSSDTTPTYAIPDESGAAIGENIVADPMYRYTTTRFTLYGSAVYQANAGGSGGTQRYISIPYGTVGGIYANNGLVRPINVGAGNKIYFSALIYQNDRVTAPGYFKVDCYDAAGTSIGTVLAVAQVSSPNAWFEVNTSAVVPMDTAAVKFYFDRPAPDIPGDSANIAVRRLYAAGRPN